MGTDSQMVDRESLATGDETTAPQPASGRGSTVLAIDPGNIDSGWCIIDADTGRPLRFAKTDNDELNMLLRSGAVTADLTAIEMIASYGMPVGREVFETCVWIGRLHAAIEHATASPPTLVVRQPVKLHHCHSSSARDSNVRQALVDRFASGQGNYGKGTKKDPGWFYGFHRDVWQAYALAVYAADVLARPGR